MTAGLDEAIDFDSWTAVWLVGGEFLMLMWTLSVAKTGGGGDDAGPGLYVFSDST